MAGSEQRARPIGSDSDPTSWSAQIDWDIVVEDELRDAIGAGASSVAIAQLAAASSYRPMYHDGFAKVLSGLTTFEELVRVVALSGER